MARTARTLDSHVDPLGDGDSSNVLANPHACTIRSAMKMEKPDAVIAPGLSSHLLATDR